jgi:hypothetical protein
LFRLAASSFLRIVVRALDSLNTTIAVHSSAETAKPAKANLPLFFADVRNKQFFVLSVTSKSRILSFGFLLSVFVSPVVPFHFPTFSPLQKALWIYGSTDSQLSVL